MCFYFFPRKMILKKIFLHFLPALLSQQWILWLINMHVHSPYKKKLGLVCLFITESMSTYGQQIKHFVQYPDLQLPYG